MADIIDERLIPTDEVEVASLDELGQKAPEPPKDTSGDVPDKYRGKALRDLVQMHQEAEKLLGKQGSEIGDLRRVVDDYISTQTQLAQPKAAPVEEIDFFSDPKAAVARALDEHPALKEVRQVTQQNKQARALAELERRHPDMQAVLQDPGFLEWVDTSNIRRSQLQKADREYDYEAADDLFSTYKERKSLLNRTVAQEKTARKDTVQRASTGSASVSSEATPKKIYRRQDIIELMKTNPSRYASLADEIMLAYAEKRVR
jgi:hypothetical protein